MDHESINARLFYGTTATLRPGDRLPPGTRCHDAPAAALVQAWRDASEGTKTPFVYEVVMTKRHGLAVAHDVLVDSRLAGQALDLAARTSLDR